MLCPVTPERRELSVDIFDGECLGIKRVAQPFKPVGVLGVVGIAKGLQQAVVASGAPTVLRRTGKLTAGADRIGGFRCRRQNLFEDEAMAPTIAEIV